MKTLSLGLVLVGSLLATEAFAKVGLVNVQKVLVTVGEGVKVRKKLETAFNEKKELLKGDEDKVKKMQEDFGKQGLVLNDAAKAKKEKEIQQLIMDLQNKTMEYQKEIHELEKKYKEPILDKVQGIVEDISKDNNVEVTYESSTSPIIYAKDKVDLTDDVIKAYDKKYPAK